MSQGVTWAGREEAHTDVNHALTGVPNTLGRGGVVSYVFELAGGEMALRHIPLASFTEVDQACQKGLKGWL